MINAENKKQLAILLCAIGLGLFAAFAASTYIETKINKQTQIIATRAKKQNKLVVNELDIVKRELKKAQAKQEQLAKKQAQIRISAAQAPTKESATPSRPLPTTAFSLKTPFGKRALTIRIDSLSAVGGLITAGDFIDILSHFSTDDRAATKAKNKDRSVLSKTTTAILFQNIQVLAVGTKYLQPVPGLQGKADVLGYAAQQKARSLYVTLAVTPEEASLLTFIQARGRLQLILRSPQEDTTQVLQVASWDALAEFVLDRQGTELNIPRPVKKVEKSLEVVPLEDEVRPFIQIFKSGKELNL